MDQMTGFYWIRLRAALGLEIRTGLRNSKGSVLALLRKKGITKSRLKRQAWLDLDAYCVEQGLPEGKKPWTELGCTMKWRRSSPMPMTLPKRRAGQWPS